MAHALVEEFVHAEQALLQVDFEAQRSAFSYAERPYEVEAKALASELVGFVSEPCAVLVVRREPPGPLFDRPAQG